MQTNTIIIAALSIVLVILLLLFVVARKMENKTPNYKALFILGIIYIPLGFSINYAFTGLGVLFLIIGLANKKKWEKSKSWAELSYTERRVKISLIIILFLLFIYGMLAFFVVK